MNKIYRIIFNVATGRWIVASEMAKGRSKSGGARSVAVMALLGSVLTVPAFAGVSVSDNGVSTSGTNSVRNGGSSGGYGAQASYQGIAMTNDGDCQDLNASYTTGTSALGNMSNLFGSLAAQYSVINDYGVQANKGSSYVNWGSSQFIGGTGSIGTNAGGTTVNNGSTLAYGYNSTAIGCAVRTYGFASTGMGFGAQASGDGSISLGVYSDAKGDSSIAMGTLSKAEADRAIALGHGADAVGVDAIAIGTSANAGAGPAIAIGQNASATGAGASVAVGMSANASGQNGAAIGVLATASGLNSTAFGYNAAATGTGASAFGQQSSAVDYSTAFGTQANAKGDRSVALGSNSLTAAGTLYGAALGRHTSVMANSAVAIGNEASAQADNSVALGANSLTDRANTISVGAATSYTSVNGVTSPAQTRQIVNVGAGTELTDAVNVSQLKPVVTALGGGAAIDGTTGAVTGPTYVVHNADGSTTPVNNVGAAITNIDGRVAQNTTDIADNTTAISTIATQLNSGTIGLVQQASAGANLTVGKDTDGAAVDFAGTAGARKLINVADGTVASGSQEAVNGGQLFTANQAVAQNTADISSLDGRVTTNEGSITSLDSRVTTNEGDITTLKTDVTNLDGRVTQNANDLSSLDSRVTTNEGDISTLNTSVSNIDARVTQNTTDISSLDGRVATNEGDISTLKTDVTNIDGRVTQNTTDIATITSQLTSGTVGLVQQASAGADLTVGKDTDGAAVNFAGTAGARKLSGVADGTIASGSQEAVNGGQLYTTNQAVAQNTADISSLDGRVATNEGDITTLQNTVNNISTGTVGLVQQASVGADLTVGKDTDGAAVSFADKYGAARKLVGVEDGLVDSGSKEAVNGGQLYTTNQAVGQNAADISSLDGRVTTNEGSINSLDSRVTTNEGDISTLKTDVTNIDGRVTTAEGNITSLDNRVTTNEGDITTLQNTVNNISSGTVGLVQQASAGADLTVGKDTDGVAVNFAGTAGARKLSGVADGTIASGSQEAVNGGQLYTTNQAVAQNTADISSLDGRVTTNEGSITSLDSRVTTNEGDITTLKTDVTNIDGRVTTAEGNITSLDNRVTNNESSISTLNTNVSNIDGRVTNVEGSVSTITNQLNSGEIGLVQYDAAAQSVTVAKGQAGTTVDFRNNGGAARRLKGVAAGAEDEDGVNVAQLKSSLGGTASYDPTTGAYIGPVYTVTNADGSTTTVNNVGGAITNLDARTYSNTTAITNLANNINSGTVGLVQQASAGANLTVGKDTDGAAIDVAGTAGARKVVNVADGAVAANSKEAVNGGQLYGVSQSVASALGGGSVVNDDGTISAPKYTVTNADGSTLQVNGVEGAVSNLDSRVYNNTQAIAGNTTAINNLTTQINNGEVGLVKQDAATRQISVAKDTDGDSVSVAGTAGDRVVTGVASAKADNDAVNLGQLKAAGVVGANGESKSVVTYDDAGKTSMTMGGDGATTAVTIHNVADGVADHDAVNISQLNQRLQQNTTEVLVQANSYTDQKIDDVWNGMDQLSRQVIKQDRSISQHGAMSMAEAQMTAGAAAAAVGNPNGAWSVGLGSESGYGAISAGYAKPIGKKSQISFGAAFSGDERSVGVGFAHKL